MTARRRYRSYHLSRFGTFGPGLALPLYGWVDLGKPLHWAGLGVMTAAGLLVVPVAVLVVMFFLPAVLMGGLVPRQWRISYRGKHGREGARSAYITKRLKYVVFAADRYRCAHCGIHWDQAGHLEVDHVRPWSLGGLTTLFNCRALCPRCNKIKSNFWRFRRSGRAVYVPFAGWSDPILAEAILRSERRTQWSPFRLLRAAWALG